MRKLLSKENLYMGLVFLLINITSIVVVTNIIGFNLPLAFLACGVNTIIFHKLTKDKLPSFIGTSGLFIGGILTISAKYGTEYAVGGVFLSGVLYIIISLLFIKWQDNILNLIPQWLLSVGIVLIGLGLLPIGKDIISSNLVVGLISLITIVIIELKASNKVRLFSMPIAIAVGSVYYFITNGIPTVEPQKLLLTLPKFNLESFFTISIITFATIFEIFADCKLSGNIANIDLFKEVGMFRVIFANGVGSMINGLIGVAPTTSFSENNAGVQLTGKRNPDIQIVTSILFIILAFLTPVTNLFLMLPQEAFGGCLIFLFANIVINGINQIINLDLKNNKKVNMIMSLMLAVFSMSFIVGGVSVSSIAVAMVIGIILNKLIKDEVV